MIDFITFSFIFCMLMSRYKANKRSDECNTNKHVSLLHSIVFVDKNVMAKISTRSSVSLLRSLSVHLDAQSFLGLTTVVSVAPMHCTVASLRGPRVLTVTS